MIAGAEFYLARGSRSDMHVASPSGLRRILSAGQEVAVHSLEDIQVVAEEQLSDQKKQEGNEQEGNEADGKAAPGAGKRLSSKRTSSSAVVDSPKVKQRLLWPLFSSKSCEA